jgi:hypothetical protein
MEGQAMLRTGIAALVVCVISATDVSADDVTPQKSGTLMKWLSTGNGARGRASSVRPATTRRAVRQARHVQQTDDTAVATQPQHGESPLNPLPIQMAPVLPNQSVVSGPQYFSVSNANGIAQPVHPGRNWQQYQAPQPVYRNSSGVYSTVSQGVAQAPMSQAGGIVSNASRSGAPLHPGTALYPSPVPGIPQQVGGTSISNQFLNPHEMLYAHRYRAMYPPYSYKVNGKWMVTPFGVWSHEDWHLQGTMVDVKYKSSISPFALFSPPVRR